MPAPPNDWARAAKVADVPAFSGRSVRVNGETIALFQVDDLFYALDDRCSHMGGPLSEGRIEGCQVVCPWHGARFDIPSGDVISPPAGCGVRSYPVRIDSGELYVQLGPNADH